MKQKTPTIKTDWASLVLTPTGSILVGLATPPQPRNLYFSNHDEFQQAIQSSHLKARKWIVAVPRHLCILKPLTLPAHSLAEAVRMAEFELSSLSPIPAEEVIYSCWPLSRQEHLLDVMVCLLRVNRLDDYLAPLRKLKIEPTRIVLSSLAFGPQTQPAIMAIVNESHSEVLTFHNQTLLSAIPLNGNVKRIAQEINHQTTRLSGESLKDIRFLLGGSAKDRASIEANLNGHIVRHLKTNPLVIMTTETSSLPQPSEYDLLQAQGLAALAVKNDWPEFNLLKRDTLKKRRQVQYRRRLIWSGSLTLTILFLLWLGMWGLNWRQQQCCNQIEARITPLKQSAGQVERKQQQIKAILSQFEPRQKIKELLNDLFLHTPKHISFSSLSYQNRSGQAIVRFKGQADNMANAFGYTEAMREAKCFNAVQIENVQQVARSGGSVVEFSGQGRIEKE